MSLETSSTAAAAVLAAPSRFAQFYALTKPRVVQLIVFCALIGMVLAVLAIALNWQATFRAESRWLAGLLALQVATGLGNVLLGWPLAAAVLHTGGAAALAVVATWALCESRRESPVSFPDSAAKARGTNFTGAGTIEAV